MLGGEACTRLPWNISTLPGLARRRHDADAAGAVAASRA